MKKKAVLFKFLGLFLFFIGITGCASTKVGSNITLYDENSCVICFHLWGSGEFTFKQIDSARGVDEQIIEPKNKMVIFLPCKPGSKYLLTKIKGQVVTGSVAMKNCITNEIDIEMGVNEQFYIIDVPEKPGFYYYDDLAATFVDVAELKVSGGPAFRSKKFGTTDNYPYKADNPYIEKPFKPEVVVIKNGWDFSNKLNKWAHMKSDLKVFKKLYYGTLWYDSFEELVGAYKTELDKAYKEYKDAKKNKKDADNQ
ncbi:MAG: hypothetical protein IKX23_01515 [Treponema sp.]|nr:hypothetical protein [Treponema sp.]